MYLKKVEIFNFRNIKKLDIDFNKNVNIFVGDNAQGKTSILESIYVLAFTKSCKAYGEDELIKKGENFFRVKGSFKIGNLNKKMEIGYIDGVKKLKYNDKNVSKIADYISNLNVIMFSPDDLDIIKKSPIFRRNFINTELCQLYREYLIVVNEYNRLLKIRNDYIRKNCSNIDYDYLDVITKSMASRVVIIHKYRNDFFDSINEFIGNIFYRISKIKGLSLRYKKSIDFDSFSDIYGYYKRNYSSDIDKGSTLSGPHRDDFCFYLGDDDVKLYGSQGLQRMAVLSLKLSEINIFKNVKNSYPIVLLDDIFSEIDLNKRKNLLRFIKSNIQFIITTTDINNISEKLLDKSTIFKISEGTIKKRSEKNGQ